MQLGYGVYVFCIAAVGSLSAGCSLSSMRISDSSVGVQGSGNSVAVTTVPFSGPSRSIAVRRAALISPSHVVSKKEFEAVWGETEAAWSGVDSPVSASFQLQFKLYHALLTILNRPEKRAALIKGLRGKVSTIAEFCSDDQVAVLEDASALLGQIEMAVQGGWFHIPANLDALKRYVALKRDNADAAYSLRWNAHVRRCYVEAV